MTVNSHTYQIDSMILYKFGSLISGAPTVADKINSIDITLQAQEISVFESIFSPVIRAEIAVIDPIGLLVNFPLSGEEALYIRFKNIFDQITRELYFVIDKVAYLNIADDARSMGYVLHCVAIEAYGNAKQTVQQAYHNTIPQIASDVYQQHVQKRVNDVFPKYQPLNLYVEDNDTRPQTVVIPNIHPFPAMRMLAEMAVNENSDRKHTYLMFQTATTFNFCTMQGLFEPTSRASRRVKAVKNKYVYISDQIEQPDSKLNNEGRVVTSMVVNQRLSSFHKLSLGYFHNNLFEINIGQKAVWGQPTRADEVNTMYPNLLNTMSYIGLASIEGDEEQSNRTKYVVTTNKENDDQYPVDRSRDKWGKDLIATAAMSQVDLTVTIPGTLRFDAGDLFFLEIPEMHAFNDLKPDDLISGLFVITEIKHVLHLGGFHTTVLRINKDSYLSSVDRKSRYK